MVQEIIFWHFVLMRWDKYISYIAKPGAVGNFWMINQTKVKELRRMRKEGLYIIGKESMGIMIISMMWRNC